MVNRRRLLMLDSRRGSMHDDVRDRRLSSSERRIGWLGGDAGSSEVTKNRTNHAGALQKQLARGLIHRSIRSHEAVTAQCLQSSEDQSDCKASVSAHRLRRQDGISRTIAGDSSDARCIVKLRRLRTSGQRARLASIRSRDRAQRERPAGISARQATQ